MTADRWPSLSLDTWLPTNATLHRWTQIIGKTRLSLSPFENHWWHCALYVTARGLTTSAMPFSEGNVQIDLDFLDDVLLIRTSDGRSHEVRLEPKPVAHFYREYRAALAALGIEVHIHPTPNELPDATPFADDYEHASYDGSAARRWWHILGAVDRVFKEFRSGFAGKCSPSHLWWGGLDIACTRFSGRAAPPHPGGVPNCPDYVMHEAYSRECYSAGWWPGTAGAPIAEPAFYAYAYPEPAGFSAAIVRPAQALYHTELREWILPYEAVRTASDPAGLITEFLEDTYDAAARLAGWDVAGLRSSSQTARHAAVGTRL